MAKTLSTKQKRDKLAKVMETLAVKLRDNEIGEAMWETEEPTMQILVAQISTLLSRVKYLDAVPKTALVKKSDLDEWPNILLD